MSEVKYNEMIEGVSPLAISRIVKYRFKRYGMHPLANRLIRKRHPILSRTPIVNLFYLYGEDNIFGDCRQPHFDILGADRSCLKTVWCRSHLELDQRVDAAQAKLDNFLAGLRTGKNSPE